MCSHQLHTFRPIREVARERAVLINQYKTEAQSILSSLTNQQAALHSLARQVNQTRKLVRSQVNQTFDSLARALKHRRAVLLNNLERRAKREEKAIQKKEASLVLCTARAAGALETAERASSSLDGCGAVLLSGSVHDQLLSARSACESVCGRVCDIDKEWCREDNGDGEFDDQSECEGERVREFVNVFKKEGRTLEEAVSELGSGLDNLEIGQVSDLEEMEEEERRDRRKKREERRDKR